MRCTICKKWRWSLTVCIANNEGNRDFSIREKKLKKSVSGKLNLTPSCYKSDAAPGPNLCNCSTCNTSRHIERHSSIYFIMNADTVY
jgi:hypothetical protein